jgi:ribosomal protein S15P/S13E
MQDEILRLFHVYGNDQLGKTSIVNLSVKHSINRIHFELAMYVEIGRKTLNGIIKKILNMLDYYQKENQNIYKKKALLQALAPFRKIILIFDNCKEILRDEKS